MNIGRVFANAIVRRLAVLAVAAALAWMGIGSARSQDYSGCSVTSNYSASCPDQGAAISAAVAAASASLAYYQAQIPSEPFALCEVGCTGNTCSASVRRSGLCGFQRFYRTFPVSQTCASRPSEITLFYPPSGSIACNNGCAYKYRETGDGETTQRSPTGDICAGNPDCSALGGNYIWNGYLNVCQPVAPECESGYKAHGSECVKDDSCPDGMALENGVCKQEQDTCPPGNIRSPDGSCLPGEGQCAAGEARRKNGTCGKDADGDGEADDDDDNPDNDTEKPEASGGDSCDAPPSCSGDAIACMQVKIQWRIDCNTRTKANVSGGHCGAGGMPVCAGDGCKAAEHAQLIQQWKAACALEKLSKGTGEAGTGDQPNWTKVTGTGKEGEGDDPEGPLQDHLFDPSSRLDYTGFVGGGSCPQLGVLQMPFGKTFNLDALPWFCDLLYVTRIFLALLGSFIGIGIIMGWRL